MEARLQAHGNWKNNSHKQRSKFMVIVGKKDNVKTPDVCLVEPCELTTGLTVIVV